MWRCGEAYWSPWLPKCQLQSDITDMSFSCHSPGKSKTHKQPPIYTGYATSIHNAEINTHTQNTNYCSQSRHVSHNYMYLWVFEWEEKMKSERNWWSFLLSIWVTELDSQALWSCSKINYFSPKSMTQALTQINSPVSLAYLPWYLHPAAIQHIIAHLLYITSNCNAVFEQTGESALPFFLL